jgi:hypothetical protein
MRWTVRELDVGGRQSCCLFSVCTLLLIAEQLRGNSVWLDDGSHVQLLLFDRCSI